MSLFSPLLALALALPASGQQVKFIEAFEGGLNTHSSSILLQENESPDLLNVVLEQPGAVVKREGFTDLNAAAIGGGSSDVQAVYELLQIDGDRYCVAVSSTNAYSSR